MRDEDKPKDQLIAELVELRQRLDTCKLPSAQSKDSSKDGQYYRLMFENACDLIQSIDPNGHFLYVNKAWREALGYTEKELPEITVFNIVHPDCLSHCMKLFQKVMAGDSVNEIEVDFITKTGRLIKVEGSVSPLIEEGKAVATINVFRDVTKRKRVEEELQEKNKRIQIELQLANTIQSSLFPVNLPQVEGATLAATVVSANEVGGDYCDLFITQHKKLGIAIGDVMGKGVPAALFVAMTYAFVRNYALELDSASTLVNRVNRALFPQLELTEQFITFFYALYNHVTRELVYTNAGHNPPIVYHAASGECDTLKMRDYFMGGRQDAEYREGSCTLEPGDVVLFYTDGLKEGRNKEKEQFGFERIVNLLKENSMYDPASIQEIISYEFSEFLAGEPPYDDVTMVVIKVSERDI